MVVYSIKDLEQLSGVKAHTLRIWEKRYNIIQPKRTQTNIRYYLDEDLKRILNIALLNRNGIKISKIAQMGNEQIQKKVAELTDINPTFKDEVDALMLSIFELNEDNFNRVLDKKIEGLGFERTMMDVVYPLLDRLAVMWVAGSIRSIHEKFVTELIRRKCIAEIDKLNSTKPQKFLIFLLKGETNELSLLFLHYLIKKEGFIVLNSGTNNDLDEISEAAKICQIDFIYTIINEPVKGLEMIDVIKKLVENFEETKIFVSGIQVINSSLVQFADNVTVLRSSEETMRLLRTI